MLAIIILGISNLTNPGFYTELKSLKLYMLQLHSFTRLSKNLKAHISRNQAICGFSEELYLRTHVWSNGLNPGNRILLEKEQ